jgi:SAM-dependent methyltransferase
LNTTLSLPLICPDCRAGLEADRPESLHCPVCARRVTVRDRIPRFVESEHLASFGLQWNRYEVAHDDEDRATFQAKTGVSPADLDGLRVLDAGCGGGRYSRLAGEAGAEVVGVDHTPAVEKAAELCRRLARVSFLQADLKRLPLEEASFDFAFSIGVMHHDADTRAVFDAVAKMVRPGGRLSVWLYRRNQWWQEALNNLLRRRTTRMPPRMLERWCRFGAWLGGIPLVNRTLNKIVNFSNHPDRENRICDTFDWYAPQFQHHHTTAELCDWFRAAGYDGLTVLPPEKTGRFYRWIYRRNLLIGSGVNVTGVRKMPAHR